MKLDRTVTTRIDPYLCTGCDLCIEVCPSETISSKNKASCPAEDALLATQNILLGAHCLGLGTCLIGFAIAAMKKDESIKKVLHIPQDETPYSVIAIGYPVEKYQFVTGRKPITVRYVE